jgi:3-oxoisoapionate decarboxylase
MNPLGIGQHSYGESWRPGSGAKFNNALSFLEYAHSLDAAGVQVAIKPDEHSEAEKIRNCAEQHALFFEGNLSLPKTDTDIPLFEANLKAAATAGATVARTACLSGRRYETFKSAAEFRDFKNLSLKYLHAAEPILKKQKIKLAFENHKDWLVSEHVEILRSFNSEWIGATVDIGNNIALLENAYEVVDALAPFALSTHIKDMAVQEYENGFLLSEVILGSGYLDVPRMIATLRKANPKIRLNLEMITRDPLRIPCLTGNYFATFANPLASQLAAALANAKQKARKDLPNTTGLTPSQRIAFEDQNVRACLQWANKNLNRL